MFGADTEDRPMYSTRTRCAVRDVVAATATCDIGTTATTSSLPWARLFDDVIPNGAAVAKEVTRSDGICLGSSGTSRRPLPNVAHVP